MILFTKTKKGNKLVQSCNKIKSAEARYLVTISCLAYAEAHWSCLNVSISLIKVKSKLYRLGGWCCVTAQNQG